MAVLTHPIVAYNTLSDTTLCFATLICHSFTCLTHLLSTQQVFSYLPMFTIVNNAVMVVHGGLFHTEDVLLSELNAIDRVAFSLKDLPDGGEKLEPFPRYESFALFPREQVMRDIDR